MFRKNAVYVPMRGDPRIAQPEGRFAETGSRRYGEEFCSVPPQKWKLKRPDSNIDHRRVPNQDTCSSRHDKTRPTSKYPSDYQAGDIVSWRLDNGLAHIRVVSDGFARDGTPLVIHNIGAGAQEEDVLFNWRMVGHYRYFVK